MDSELALILVEDYSLSMWQPNPYFIGFKDKSIFISRKQVLMVARLDGSSSYIVKRIIDDSLAVEEQGLTGTAYFDARWADSNRKKRSGNGFYDQSIHRAAERVRKNGVLSVVVESSNNLFQSGECPEAALYCGWYKLAHYVDAFEWKKGAVGYHIASQECQTLRRENSNVWCKRMLEHGVVATLGPVGEPYVQAFPVPEVFLLPCWTGVGH